MRTAVDADDFVASPVGAMYVGDGIAAVMPDAGLFASMIWGRPDENAARTLVRLYDAELARPPHLALCDAGALDGVDPHAFAVVTEYLNRNRDAFARVVIREALVMPPGLPGTVIAGYHAVYAFPSPTVAVNDRSEALAWLGRLDAGDALDALVAARQHDPLVGAVRAMLVESLRSTLPEAARRFGISQRSLQRRMRAADTSFHDEVQAARLALARRLLIDTDRKLTAIAHECGCSSVQSFSAMFRRQVGETPSVFRARHRG